MDKVAAAIEKLEVFTVVTVEAIFRPPIKTRQPIKPVFVAAAQKPTVIGRAGSTKRSGGEKRTVEVGFGITTRNVDHQRVPRQVAQPAASHPCPIHLFIAAGAKERR